MLLCAFCQTDARPVYACSRCYAAAYCSVQCQRGDWRRRHRLVCAAVAATPLALVTPLYEAMRAECARLDSAYPVLALFDRVLPAYMVRVTVLARAFELDHSLGDAACEHERSIIAQTRAELNLGSLHLAVLRGSSTRDIVAALFYSFTMDAICLHAIGVTQPRRGFGRALVDFANRHALCTGASVTQLVVSALDVAETGTAHFWRALGFCATTNSRSLYPSHICLVCGQHAPTVDAMIRCCNCSTAAYCSQYCLERHARVHARQCSLLSGSSISRLEETPLLT